MVEIKLGHRVGSLQRQERGKCVLRGVRLSQYRDNNCPRPFHWSQDNRDNHKPFTMCSSDLWAEPGRQYQDLADCTGPSLKIRYSDNGVKVPEATI